MEHPTTLQEIDAFVKKIATEKGLPLDESSLERYSYFYAFGRADAFEKSAELIKANQI